MDGEVDHRVDVRPPGDPAGAAPAGSARRAPGPRDRPASDEELMARFRDGEASAFDELLDRHKRGVYAFLRRSTRTAADADDLFQEVFLRVIRAAPGWQPRAKLTTWLYTIARNALIDAARRDGRNPRVVSLTDAGRGDGEDTPLAPIDTVADDTDPAPDEALLLKEHSDAVEALVAALPPDQREAFLLKREGLTFDEIAAVTASGRNTIKSRLRYALEKLRSGLDRKGLLRDPRHGREGGA